MQTSRVLFCSSHIVKRMVVIFTNIACMNFEQNILTDARFIEFIMVD